MALAQPAHDPSQHYPQVTSGPNQIGRQRRTIAHKYSI
jgi:hypothetical protein